MKSVPKWKINNKKTEKINDEKILYEFDMKGYNKELKSFLYEYKEQKIISKFYKKIERKNIIHYECLKCWYGIQGKSIDDNKVNNLLQYLLR